MSALHCSRAGTSTGWTTRNSRLYLKGLAKRTPRILLKVSRSIFPSRSVHLSLSGAGELLTALCLRVSQNANNLEWNDAPAKILLDIINEYPASHQPI